MTSEAERYANLSDSILCTPKHEIHPIIVLTKLILRAIPYFHL